MYATKEYIAIKIMSSIVNTFHHYLALVHYLPLQSLGISPQSPVYLCGRPICPTASA